MTTINGTTANDVITGTTENDVINGGAGNDRINGGAGITMSAANYANEDLPTEFYSVVGKFMLTWGTLERVIDVLLWWSQKFQKRARQILGDVN